MKELVSVEWLKEYINNKDLILLDTSLAKTVDENNLADKNLTIPLARFFNLKADFSDSNSPLPNTFPSKEKFEQSCQKLGISQSSKIVVFDNHGIYSSPRVWWMFKVMGHHNVAVLEGGLPAWIKKGFPIEKRIERVYKLGDFKALFNENYIINYKQVKRNIENQTFTIIDARSTGRFNGTEEEPRKELKSGHIKDSINIPYKDVLIDGKYKSKEELKRLFESVCNIEEKLVFSCGSGLTACIVLLACEIAFKKSKYVYDGSWTEWAKINNLTNRLQ